MSSEWSHNRFNRRAFLRICGVATLATALPSPLLALGRRSSPAQRRLDLLNIHTGERLQTVYWADGGYTQSALTAVNHLLRDHRTGDVHAMDPKLLDLMVETAATLGREPRFEIISGYRCPQTNAILRRRDAHVAQHSYHLKGQAVDLRMPDVELAQLRHTARSLRRGGVGWYPESNFVHLDTGPVRTW